VDVLNQQDLRTLSETEGEWCISIFMPTARGAEAQQNPIRLKNLLRNAEEQLAEVGARVPDAEALLQPAQALLSDADLWRNVSQGLAIFVGPQHFSYHRVPLALEELVVVRRRFHLKPLLELLSEDGHFYVLALSQDGVRLLEGTRDTAQELPLERVPANLAEALQYDQREKVMRSAVKGGGGSVYGAGGSEDVNNKQAILRYFQMVDRGVRELIADKHIPLVLAGVDYLLPIYREANTYPYLAEEGITGSPDGLSDKELHQRAWEVVEPHFAQAQAEAVARYEELAGRGEGEASNNVVEVVRAAHEGRVATLFVARDVQLWGVYRAHSHKVHVHPSRQPGDQDLLDVAAVQTFLNGGTVYVVDREAVPGGDVLAAIYRY